MADYAIGPNGTQFGGSPICTNNLLLGDVTNPGLVLKERLTEQYFTGLQKVMYEDMVIDDLMPMRASTSQRTDNVDEYRVAVGFDGISNSGGMVSMTQTTAPFNQTRQLVNRCGRLAPKTFAARGNTNAEGCNPVIDGPFPYVGMESLGRESFSLRAPVLPLCTQDYINKDPGVWAKTLDAIISTTLNSTLYRWQLEQIRWVISKARYLASPIQQNLGDGRARLPVSADLFSSFGFGHVPTHWGSADWFAGMIRLSEIPRSQNVTVELPVAILMKYKEQYIQSTGINIMEGAANTTSAINGYFRTLQDDTLIYRDHVTGRTISFKGTTRPMFVEVRELGNATAEWAFQEKWITRDSEDSNQVMPRENPNWGAYACDGNTLAAIVTVFADSSERPFYKEPMPSNNPDAAVKGVIAKYGGGKVNATLADLYPSSVELRLLTGLDAQVHLIEPLNQRYREESGTNCTRFSNLEDTYVGGYTKVGGVFVENRPREFAMFLLKMPPEGDSCVELSVASAEPDAVPAGITIDPAVRVEQRAPLVIPVDPAPAADPVGTIRGIGKSVNVKAPCTGSKTVTLKFERVAGSSGVLALAIAGTASAHAAGLPTTVSFANGQTYAEVTFTVNAWVCPTEDTTTESFTLTFGPANLTAGAFNTKKVCITCNKACVTNDCPEIEGECATC